MSQDKQDYVNWLLDNHFEPGHIQEELQFDPELNDLYRHDKEVKEYIDRLLEVQS